MYTWLSLSLSRLLLNAVMKKATSCFLNLFLSLSLYIYICVCVCVWKKTQKSLYNEVDIFHKKSSIMKRQMILFPKMNLHKGRENVIYVWSLQD